MKVLSFLILSGLFFSLFSCSTAPEFERNNENDPLSSDFIPDISNLSVSINPDKTVSLSWNDDSEYEEGFIISKSFGTNNNFIVIDTLLSNATSYIDSSKNLAVNTYYKISAYHSDGSKENLPSLFRKLSFGTINDVKVTSQGNEININSISGNFYSDKILIEKKTATSSEWSVIDTLDKNISEYSFEDLSESYSIDIRVSKLLYNNKGIYERIDDGISNSTYYNLPTNFRIVTLNEAQIAVLFQDGSDFEDEFIIYQKVVNSNSATGLIALDTLSKTAQTVDLVRHPSSVSEYEFFLAPLVKSSNTKGPNSAPFGYLMHMRPPNSYQIKSDETNSVTIRWTDGNIVGENNEVHSYYFEWGVDNINFLTSGSLSSDTKEFTINNIDTTKTYYIRTRTFNSAYSYAKLNFQKDFDDVKNLFLSLDPNSQNDAISITEDHIYQRNRIINRTNYSITSLSNTSNQDFIGGITVGKNNLYISNDTDIRIEFYNKKTLEYINSYSNAEMKNYFSVNYLSKTDEVLLGFTREKLNGNSTLVLQRWNTDFTEKIEEIEMRDKSLDPCTSVSYIVMSDSQDIGLLLCNEFSNEGANVRAGSIIKFNPYNLSESNQVLIGELARDFIFENESSQIIYFISKGDIVKYDLDADQELLRNRIFERSLYDLSFSNEENELYLVGTQRGLSDSKSTFFSINSSDFSINEQVIVNGKYYFSRDLGNNLIYFAGQGSKILRLISKWHIEQVFR